MPPPSLGHACLCICRNRDHVLPHLPLGAAIPRPGQHLRAWPRATHTCYGGAQTVGTIGREGRGALIDGSLWSPSPKLRAWSQTSGQDFRAGLRRGGPSALSQSQEAERPGALPSLLYPGPESQSGVKTKNKSNRLPLAGSVVDSTRKDACV